MANKAEDILEQVVLALEQQQELITGEKRKQREVIQGAKAIDIWEEAWHKGYQRGLSFGKDRNADAMELIEKLKNSQKTETG